MKFQPETDSYFFKIKGNFKEVLLLESLNKLNYRYNSYFGLYFSKMYRIHFNDKFEVDLFLNNG